MKHKEEEIIELYFDIIKYNQRYSEKKYGDLDLLRGQSKCLLILDMYACLTLKELSGKMKIKPSSITEIVTKLDGKGLIRKEKSTKDKRITYLYLSDLGKEEVKKIKRKRNHVNAYMLSNLASDEKENLYDYLKKIKNVYEDDDREEI